MRGDVSNFQRWWQISDPGWEFSSSSLEPIEDRILAATMITPPKLKHPKLLELQKLREEEEKQLAELNKQTETQKPSLSAKTRTKSNESSASVKKPRKRVRKSYSMKASQFDARDKSNTAKPKPEVPSTNMSLSPQGKEKPSEMVRTHSFREKTRITLGSRTSPTPVPAKDNKRKSQPLISSKEFREVSLQKSNELDRSTTDPKIDLKYMAEHLTNLNKMLEDLELDFTEIMLANNWDDIRKTVKNLKEHVDTGAV